jgi:hypothetical protein
VNGIPLPQTPLVEQDLVPHLNKIALEDQQQDLNLVVGSHHQTHLIHDQQLSHQHQHQPTPSQSQSSNGSGGGGGGGCGEGSGGGGGGTTALSGGGEIQSQEASSTDSGDGKGVKRNNHGRRDKGMIRMIPYFSNRASIPIKRQQTVIRSVQIHLEIGLTLSVTERWKRKL